MEVWNGVWKKILVWNGRFLVWNGRKLPVWNMEKSSSIPFHTTPWFQKLHVSETPLLPRLPLILASKQQQIFKPQQKQQL